jgi:acyl carrier protein
MMEDKMQIEQRIFEYIGKNSHADISKVNQQTMLFKEGILDSMGFVLFIDFLEEGFGIKADDADLVEENFESITAITNYVQRKRTAKAA